MIHLKNTIIFVYPQSTKRALARSAFKGVCVFQVNLEFGSVGFCGGSKAEERGKKPSGQGREPTLNKHVYALQLKDYQLNNGVKIVQTLCTKCC